MRDGDCHYPVPDPTWTAERSCMHRRVAPREACVSAEKKIWAWLWWTESGVGRIDQTIDLKLESQKFSVRSGSGFDAKVLETNGHAHARQVIERWSVAKTQQNI